MKTGKGKKNHRSFLKDTFSIVFSFVALIISGTAGYLLYLDRGSIDISLHDSSTIYGFHLQLQEEKQLKSGSGLDLRK